MCWYDYRNSYLDIKPYHHLESVDVFGPNIKYAQWIYDSCKAKKCEVIIKEKAIKNIEDILKDNEKKLLFYDKKEDLIKLIKGVLEIVHILNILINKKEIYYMDFM